MMSRRHVAAAVLTAGIAIGTAVAVADRAPATRTASLPPLPAAAQVAPLKPVGATRLSGRVSDPGGGPPWTVRVFRVKGREGHPSYPCVQLGRVVGGRFGWLADDYAFRAARLDQLDVPTLCGGRFYRGAPELAQTTTVTGADDGSATPGVTATWGLLPADVAGLRLRDGTSLPRLPGGVVLAVGRVKKLGVPVLVGTLTGGKPFDLRRTFSRPRPSRPRPEPGTERVVARTPDPAGGANWGMRTGRTASGELCVSGPDRAVGDQLALVDGRLATATTAPFEFFDCTSRRAPTDAVPLRTSVAVMSGRDDTPTATANLRRLSDRTIIHGRATDRVASVTIRTSRDTRTVIPDAGTGAVLAVYDGTFPGEVFRITANLVDGGHVTTTKGSGG